MTYSQVLRELSGVTYSDAIKQYQKQKEQFLEQYEKALNDKSKKNVHDYINNFINEINNGHFQGRSFEVANKLMSEIENGVISALEGVDTSKLHNLRDASESQYKNLTKKGVQELQEFLDQYYSVDQIHDIVVKHLKNLGINYNDKGLKPQDILNYAKSHALQTLYYNTMNKKASGNKASLAGFFEEALVHKATVQLTKHLENKTSAIQTGSIKIKSDSLGKSIDTVFDEYFNFLSGDLDKTFKESINVDEKILLQGFGAQVKLKNLPWRVKYPKGKYFPIGENSILYNAWQNKKSWIDGIKFLEKHVRQAMGDNVMYIAGNSFIWTAELIAEARAREYFLAFYYNDNKNEFTKTIRWEGINISKLKD